MTRPLHEPDPESEPQVLPALADELRAMFEPSDLKVPPAVTARILNDAHAQLARGRARARARVGGPRLLLRWAGAAAAAAAVVVLVVRFTFVAPQPDALHATSLPVPADINRDGRIDILDALALARAVEANGQVLHDVTGDGVVDQRDIDAVAMLAVSLKRGGVR